MLGKGKILLMLLISSMILTGCVATQTTQVGLTGGEGSVEVVLTDAPIDNVKSVYVTITDISLAFADGSAPYRILQDNIRVDLLELEGIEEVLGSVDIPAGVYGQIRVSVANVEVELINGMMEDVMLPSGTVKIVGPIEIKQDEQTQILLDFDAGKSLIFNNAQIVMKPVIKLDRVVHNNDACSNVAGENKKIPLSEGAIPSPLSSTEVFRCTQ